MNASWKTILLLLAVSKCILALRLKCENRVCTVYNLRTSEDTFVYRYFPNNTGTIVYKQLLVEYADRAFLEDINSLVQSVVLTDSTRLVRLSISGRANPSSLTITYTGLSRVDVEEENHQLQQLLVLNGKLTRVPETIDRLKRLVTLRLRYNLIAEVDLAQFCLLPQLYYLDVRNNKITHVYRTDRCSDVPVRYIYLASNKLSSLNMTAFDGFTRLQYLDVCNNQLQSLAGSFVGPVLSDLKLANNHLTTLSFCHWYVPKLDRLVLSTNALTNIPDCLSSVTTAVSHLGLCVNNISTVALDSFAGMDNLHYLDVCKNLLTAVALNTTIYPKSLKTIFLNHNRLKQLDLSWVPLRKLAINVAYNSIAQFDVSKVSLNVTTLTMTGNPIDCSWSALPVPGMVYVDRASARCVRNNVHGGRRSE